MKKKYSDGLVTVMVTFDQVAVAVAKTILESAGIKYIVKGEGPFAPGGAGFYPGVLTLIEIQVLESDAEEARQLLDGLSEESRE